MALAACALCGVSAAGCGGGQRQDAGEPSGRFPVDIVRASFPTTQRLAESSRFEVAVRNAGSRTVPDIAVTVETGGKPATTDRAGNASAFGVVSQQPGVAEPSRPVWVLDSGPRGGVTAYTNTWALGRLRPGEMKTFVWRVTAVKPGTYTVKYQVAAGLNGKAKAVASGGGGAPSGQFTVRISGKPADARVGPNGEVIKLPRE
jgi:hypothetical protein